MLYDFEKGNMTITLTGDLMLTKRLSVFKEDRYLQLRELLKGADAAFTNFESSAREYGEGSPSIRRGTYMTTEPKLLDDLKWLGINIVSCANNHAFDYGEGGILATIRNLSALGMPYAGIGRNLGEARSPAYLDTPGGRVGLIAVTSQFDVWNQAGEQRPDCQGRPGINPLGFQSSYVVDRQAIDGLRRISAGLGLEAEKERGRKFGFLSRAEVGADDEKECDFLGRKFLLGEGFAIQTKANEKDVTENLRQVHEAKRQADWVIVSVHSHEMGGPTFLTASKRTEVEGWAAFARDFARRCIDEGADIVVGHGPHFTLGVELYKGKPIFHSLGDFVMQNDTVRFLPAFSYSRFGLDHRATPADFMDARSDSDTRSQPADPLFWESFCPVCRFTSGNLKEIVLYPLDLGFGRRRSQRGRPLLADPETGKKIITRVARLSKDLGTKIVYRDGCGIIDVG